MEIKNITLNTTVSNNTSSFIPPEELQQRFTQDLQNCTQVLFTEVQFLQPGNMLYYRKSSDGKLLYGKLLHIIRDSNGQPIKLLFPSMGRYNKNARPVEIELTQIDELFKKCEANTSLEFERLRLRVDELEKKIETLTHQQNKITTTVKELTKGYNTVSTVIKTHKQ